jgi:cytochrome c oxidase subunit 2
MTRILRPRRLAATLLAGAAMFALAACGGQYPNSTFHHNTDFNKEIDELFDRLMFFGTIVFIIVEALLLYVIIRFRRRPGQAEPKHVHGNTTLEVLWTAIPAIILVFIAIPTVRTIFRTQAKAVPNALQVEVIGHQWWWEFRYPEYTTRNASGRLDTLSTANELYLPAGRTVNFALKTADVIHSFWIPQLAGKRDVVANHTNYLWFTPDSALGAMAFNGHCAEYCGASHANMKFRTYTVTPAQFASWVAGQQRPAALGAVAAPGQTSTTAGGPAAAAATASQAQARTTGPDSTRRDAAVGSDAASRSQSAPTSPSFAAGAAAGQPATQPAGAAPAAGDSAAAGYVYPADKLPRHVVPSTPVPATLRYDTRLVGDPVRGQQVYSSNACIGCHYIAGNPMSIGKIGPNLTHIGSRHTLAAGLFANNTENLAKWIKNSRAMKPGVLMPALGRGEYDPITKQTVTTGGLSDQQIADIVAYLQALK